MKNKISKKIEEEKEMRVKVKALINFFDVDVKEQRVKDKSIWTCEKERADYLLEHKAVEIIEVEPDIKLTHGDIIEENIIPLENEEKLEELKEEIEKHIEKPKKKKSSKK